MDNIDLIEISINEENITLFQHLMTDIIYNPISQIIWYINYISEYIIEYSNNYMFSIFINILL